MRTYHLASDLKKMLEKELEKMPTEEQAFWNQTSTDFKEKTEQLFDDPALQEVAFQHAEELLRERGELLTPAFSMNDFLETLEAAYPPPAQIPNALSLSSFPKEEQATSLRLAGIPSLQLAFSKEVLNHKQNQNKYLTLAVLKRDPFNEWECLELYASDPYEHKKDNVLSLDLPSESGEYAFFLLSSSTPLLLEDPVKSNYEAAIKSLSNEPSLEWVRVFPFNILS